MHNLKVGQVVRINTNSGNLRRYGIIKTIGDYWVTLEGSSTALYRHHALTPIVTIDRSAEEKSIIINSLLREDGLLIVTYEDSTITHCTNKANIIDINKVVYIETNKVQLVL